MQNRSCVSVSRAVALCALLAAFSAPLSAETPWEALARSRTLASRAEASRLLERNLASSESLEPYYLLELARIDAAGGDWSGSLRWSRSQKLDALPEGIADQVHWWYAEALVSTGDASGAERLLRARIDTGKVADPSVYLAWFRLASSGAEKIGAKFDAAFSSLAKAEPRTWALSRYLEGIAAVRSGEWSYAAVSFKGYSACGTGLFPDQDPWSRYYLAYSLYRLGRWSEAVAAFSAYLDGWANHDRSWQAALAAALSSIQAGTDPLPFAERAFRLAPGNDERSESAILLASVQIDRKLYADAERVLSGVSDGTTTGGLTASAPRALFMLGDVAMRRKQNSLAEERWLSLASRFPKNPLAGEAVYRSAELRYLSADWKGAADLFGRYRKAWPSGSSLDLALWSGGSALMQAGNPDLAILWWEDLVRKFPASAYASRAYAELVSVNRDRKDWASARRWAEQYRSAFPREAKNDGMDHELELISRLERGEPSDAAALYAQWVREGRATSAAGRETGLSLARAYLADYRTRNSARDILRELTAQAPRNPAALDSRSRSVFAAAFSLLGNILREDSDFDGASSVLLASGNLYAPLDGDRSAEALYAAADCFLQAGLRSDAEKTVETLVRTWPGSVWAGRAKILME